MRVIGAIINYLKGYLHIRLLGTAPERFLNACMHRDIYVWNIQHSNGNYEMDIYITDFRKLKPILKKTGMRAVILKRHGFPFFMFHYQKRHILIFGTFMAVTLVYLMSVFVWDIHITGNRRYTDETLQRFLTGMHIRPGIRADAIDCAEIAASLRQSYDQIIWVSVSVEGSRLQINIRENEDTEVISDQTDYHPEYDLETGNDLVAEQDGEITDMIVRKGVPLVKEGDNVIKGQILVSGAVPVINDSEEIIGYRYQKADADIRAKIQTDYQDVEELQYLRKVYYDYQKEEPYIQIGNLYIETGDKIKKSGRQEIYTLEKSIPIGEHFLIPIRFGSRVSRFYAWKKQNRTEAEAEQRLRADLQHFIDTQEKKGVEIISNDVKIYTGRKNARAEGALYAIADIAVCKPISIMEDKPDGDD